MNSKYLANPVAPTQLLPRLAQLDHISSIEIKAALDTLCALYFPHTLSASNIITDALSIEVFTVLNSTPTQSPAAIPSRQPGIGAAASVPDSGYASAEEDDDDPDTHECQAEDAISALRSDPFERAYAIKWLTGFVGRSDIWLSCSLPDDEEEDEPLREGLVEEAARLINAFSGDTPFSTDDEAKDGGSISRSFSFSTPYPSFGRDCVRSTAEISIQLNDAPLSSSDHTSVGLQSWGSSIILTERICADPFAFAILTRPDEPPTALRCSDIPSRPLRVLELGAGTGLLSITTSKLLRLHSRSAEIVATDYHPNVLTNLSSNVHTNLLHHSEAGTNSSSITIHAFDWEHSDYSCPPFDEPFDVILAADVVYHPLHAAWIKSCVERLLRKPSSRNREGGLLWLIIPIRMTGRHEGMHRTVEAVFPIAGVDGGGGRTEARDCELHTLELSEVPRREGVGRADESAYKMHKIGWVRQ
ncbi:hypothetical protein JOM56_006818 [Amanita muscaria]